MEDAHTHILKLADDAEAMFFGGWLKRRVMSSWITGALLHDACIACSFSFSVYDGHGGAKIAAHVSKHLHKHIVDQEDYKNGDIKQAIVKVPYGFVVELLRRQVVNIVSLFPQGFLECDTTMRTEESLKDEMSGSTAITVLMRQVGAELAMRCRQT